MGSECNLTREVLVEYCNYGYEYKYKYPKFVLELYSSMNMSIKYYYNGKVLHVFRLNISVEVPVNFPQIKLIK